jgi:ubiquinone/menaquinone biosynthesis C-methylase UbiE
MKKSSMAEKIVLHVGCGSRDIDNLNPFFRHEGYRELRLDIDPAVEPDIVATMLDMGAVDTASVDAVFSSHNIEHLFAHEVVVALTEFRRVLKPDGFAMIIVPDLQAVAELVARDELEDMAYSSPSGPISPLDMLYGHTAAISKGNTFMAHKTGFTSTTLRQKLMQAGFARAEALRKGFTLFFCAYMPLNTMEFSLQ